MTASSRPLFSVKGIVFSALFGALLSVMSYIQIRLGFSPVPITLQNMAVMIAGALLGAYYGFFSMFLVVFLVALGLPLLHGQGGLGLLLGTTGGFIWMYPISAMLIGWLVSKVKGNGWASYAAVFVIIEVCGSLLLYVSGVPWFAYKFNVSFGKALSLSCFPYLPGDAAKALAVTLIIMPIRRIFPRVR
ncbi:biotin transporter BioY [Paenibacillus ginsengarvi]|uniref:Biotin transporter n=1 Tax=Paenibacillus ginsengarvi TaxID=400777 RepID=A0A3B0BXG3_9BACL|nr:biotin transporter BioY [Paenibacillus ginsengarvi]RKN78215.1 biotin transporter BioY [Paenibacillus ginsengarvi]